MKILLIAATHGNEIAGIKFYRYLLNKRSDLLEHIDFIIGNPRAYTRNKRYVDTDLNRSYNVDSSGYEAKRAKEITRYIGDTKPDLVIDMHSTNCKQPICLIVGNISGNAKRQFIRSSHIRHILQVGSLNDIASIADNVIGYEIPNSHLSVDLFGAVEDDLRRCIENKTYENTKLLYRMTGKIYKNEISADDAATLINFEMHPLGFVPIMTGNNSYAKQTDYLGFKSLPPEKIDI